MRAEEQPLQEAVQRQLEDAGFFVAREVEHVGKGARVQADIVAYAPDENGTLKPEIIVEVKSRPGKYDRTSALAQLSRYAVAFDTPRAYLYDGTWYEVDPTFTEAHETVPPRPTRVGEGTGGVELTVDLVRPSVRRALWNVLGVGRSKAKQQSEFSIGMLHDVLGLVGHEFRGWVDRHPLDRWRIAKTVASELLDSQFRTIRLPMSLADAMANLLAADANWQVADPACGVGTLLLSVGDRGFRRDSPVQLFGTDRDNRLVEIARELVRFAGTDLNVIPLEASVPSRPTLHGAITFGPIAGKRAEPFRLPSGQWTRDEEAIALAALVSRIAPGGRVVFGTTQRLLFSGAFVEFRRYLSEKFRIVAVVELPPRSLDGTSVAPALIVIENTAPGETLVARLEDDWANQLSEAGEFYKAYVSHLRNR
jgi:SAM-dependent methyltransferase